MHIQDSHAALDGDDLLQEDPEAILIHSDARYAAFGKDVEFMWRWEIFRDGEFVQEGCSLSENSAREAVAYVIRYMHRQDAGRGVAGGASDEIQKLLRESGLGAPKLVSRSQANSPDAEKI